jgi:hypothetical protein
MHDSFAHTAHLQPLLLLLLLPLPSSLHQRQCPSRCCLVRHPPPGAAPAPPPAGALCSAASLAQQGPMCRSLLLRARWSAAQRCRRAPGWGRCARQGTRPAGPGWAPPQSCRAAGAGRRVCATAGPPPAPAAESGRPLSNVQHPAWFRARRMLARCLCNCTHQVLEKSGIFIRPTSNEGSRCTACAAQTQGAIGASMEEFRACRALNAQNISCRRIVIPALYPIPAEANHRSLFQLISKHKQPSAGIAASLSIVNLESAYSPSATPLPTRPPWSCSSASRAPPCMAFAG